MRMLFHDTSELERFARPVLRAGKLRLATFRGMKTFACLLDATASANEVQNENDHGYDEQQVDQA